MEWYAKDLPGVFDVLLWLVAIATTKQEYFRPSLYGYAESASAIHETESGHLAKMCIMEKGTIVQKGYCVIGCGERA